tara:strand:- start:318 stop:521 length:204 start_codon:yes stop_codon:yes gene_type:complete
VPPDRRDGPTDRSTYDMTDCLTALDMSDDLHEWPPDWCDDPTDRPTDDMTDCLTALDMTDGLDDGTA